MAMKQTQNIQWIVVDILPFWLFKIAMEHGPFMHDLPTVTYWQFMP